MVTRGPRQAADQVRQAVTSVPLALDSGAAGMRPPSTTVVGIGLLVAGVALTVLTVLVGTRITPTGAADSAVSGWLAATIGSITGIHPVARVVGVIVSPPVLVGVAVAFAVALLMRGANRLAAWLAVTAGMTVMLGGLLSALLATGRSDDAWTVLVNDSYPSTYAATVVAVSGGLLIVGVLSWPRFRWGARTVATTAVLASALDRLVLGASAPTDILGGWLLGATVIAGTMLSFGVSPRRRRRSRRSVDGDDGDEPPAPRCAVIYNPIKILSETDFRQLVRQAAAAHGYAEPTWHPTTRDDSGVAMTRAALATRAELVLVAGGDGTVRIVCGELAGTQVPLGIVASGSGNLLARNLALPLEQPEAIEVAFAGHNLRIDTVAVSGDDLPDQSFVVMAGIGLDAAIVVDTGDRLKRRAGWMAYVLAGLRHVSFPAVEVEITVDDAPPIVRRTRAVMIGNVGTLTGGVRLLPDAELDDGTLDIALVSPTRVTDWGRVAYRVATRRNREDRQLEYLTARRIRVRGTGDDPIPRQLDGDVVTRGRELVCEVKPRVLTVRVATSIRSPRVPTR